jgi:hypothetical protein
MHKRRLSASGEALYDGRLGRVLYLISFVYNAFAAPKTHKL